MANSISEQWRPVVGFDGYYEVSNLGNVRSVDRIITNSLGRDYFYPGVPMRPRPQNNGYLSVGLKREGEAVRRNVHRLVLAAFVGPCPDGMEVRHTNGDKTDNRLANIRYGTLTENMADQVRHGTHRQTQKTHCPRGHELALPNLVASHWKRGMRDCRACGQASAHLSRNRTSSKSFQEISDLKHEALMAKGV